MLEIKSFFNAQISLGISRGEPTLLPGFALAEASLQHLTVHTFGWLQFTINSGVVYEKDLVNTNSIVKPSENLKFWLVKIMEFFHLSCGNPDQA